jgi:hypothetical protein
MKRDSFIKLPLSWLLFAVIWFPHTSANGQTYSAEQARKEGEVILYSTITVGAFDQLSKALKEKYPFITVRHIRLGPAQQLARIMQEQRSGQFLADVVYNNPNLFNPFEGIRGSGKIRAPSQKISRIVHLKTTN